MEGLVEVKPRVCDATVVVTGKGFQKAIGDAVNFRQCDVAFRKLSVFRRIGDYFSDKIEKFILGMVVECSRGGFYAVGQHQNGCRFRLRFGAGVTELIFLNFPPCLRCLFFGFFIEETHQFFSVVLGLGSTLKGLGIGQMPPSAWTPDHLAKMG